MSWAHIACCISFALTQHYAGIADEDCCILIFRYSFYLVFQVSEAKKKKAASKKAKTPGAIAAKAETEAASPNENSSPSNGLQEITKGVEDVGISNDRTCTSILTSHPQSRDIHLESFTLLFHGHELLADSSLELNFGRCAELKSSTSILPYFIPYQIGMVGFDQIPWAPACSF